MPINKIIEIQPGGPGASQFYSLGLRTGVSQGLASTVTIGEKQYTDEFGRDFENGGDIVIVNTKVSGTPSPDTFTLELAETVIRDWISRLEGKKTVRSRPFCNDYTDMLDIHPDIGAQVYSDVYNTSRTEPVLADDTQNVTDAQRIVLGQRASGNFRLFPVEHTNISATVTDIAVNDILKLGRKKIAIGNDCCGDNENRDGTEEWLACTDQDDATLPHLLYSNDKGANWSDITLGGLTDADALSITKAGNNIVIGCGDTGGGVFFLPLSDIQNADTGDTLTPIESTGISAAVTAVKAATSSTVYACGAAGAVYVSTDGGRTFVSAGSAVTASALNCIAVASEQLIWIGGAAGALVKIDRGTMSLVVVPSLSDAINCIAVPRFNGRLCEVFLGTSGGEIIRSRNKGVAWLSIFDATVGAIDQIAFAGAGGQIMWVLQASGSSTSRVLRDHTGGVMHEGQYDIVGTYTSPANAGLNALAAADANFAMVVGEVSASQGYLGKIA